MTYRLYFSSQPLHGVLSDTALKTAVPVDFHREVDALRLSCEFLHLHLMYPVALDRPDGTRLTAEELREWCHERGIGVHPEESTTI